MKAAILGLRGQMGLVVVLLPMLSACVTTGGPKSAGGEGGNAAQQSGGSGTAEKIMTGQQKMEIVARQLQEIPPRVFGMLPQKINRTTFGPMHKSLDFVNYECHMALTPAGERCSIAETLGYAYDTGTLSSQIVQAILPQSSLVFDPELDRLNLRSHFKYAGAEQKPHVSVIEATPSRIDFLVKMPKATVAEAHEAAKAYCAMHGKPANFAGVNIGCIRADAALISANQRAARITGNKADKPQNLWYSYGVMAFDCGSVSNSGTLSTAGASAEDLSGKTACNRQSKDSVTRKTVCSDKQIEAKEKKTAKQNQMPVKTEFKQISLSDKRCQNALKQTPSFERNSARCCQVMIEHYESPKKEKSSVNPYNRCGTSAM